MSAGDDRRRHAHAAAMLELVELRRLDALVEVSAAKREALARPGEAALVVTCAIMARTYLLELRTRILDGGPEY
jgi:inactivated superfamily I helicase